MRSYLFLLSVALLASAVEHEARAPEVLTAVRVYHTIIEQSPFLVEATSTVVWTQSPSITESQPAPTELPSDLPSGVTVSIPASIGTEAPVSISGTASDSVTTTA